MIGRLLRKLGRVLAGMGVLVVLLAGVGGAYQTIATRRDLARVPPPGRLVDIGGYHLHIWCMGSGSPTVILESGLGGGAFTWPQVQPELGKSTQVCAYDRAGLGYSDPSPSPRTSGHIAKELALLIERSGIRGPVVLAAASLGGLSARVFASEYRDRAGGLVLIDASHERQRERLAAVGLDEPLPPGLKLVVMSASLGLLRIRGETLGLEPGRADPSVRKYLDATAHRASRYRAAYDELNQWPESVKQVAASKLPPDLPVIVLTAGVGYGAAEKIHRELQDELATLTDRTCQVIARHSGHVISNDDPRLVVDAIRELIQASSERRVPDCDGLSTRDKGA